MKHVTLGTRKSCMVHIHLTKTCLLIFAMSTSATVTAGDQVFCRYERKFTRHVHPKRFFHAQSPYQKSASSNVCAAQVEETFMRHVIRHWQGSLSEMDSSAAMQLDEDVAQAAGAPVKQPF